jgi:hypothetical protein
VHASIWRIYNLVNVLVTIVIFYTKFPRYSPILLAICVARPVYLAPVEQAQVSCFKIVNDGSVNVAVQVLLALWPASNEADSSPSVL